MWARDTCCRSVVISERDGELVIVVTKTLHNAQLNRQREQKEDTEKDLPARSHNAYALGGRSRERRETPDAFARMRARVLQQTHSASRRAPPSRAGGTAAQSTDGKGLLGLPKLPFLKERVPGEPAAGGAPGKLKALL